MVSDNVPTSRHHGAPKHGDALLVGLVRCRRCGRKLTVRYTGTTHNIPRYSCWRGLLDTDEPRSAERCVGAYWFITCNSWWSSFLSQKYYRPKSNSAATI